MKKRGKGLLQVIMMLGVAAFVGTSGYSWTGMANQVVAAEVTSDEESTLTEVDLSKGVEYIYSAGTVVGVNLNGNSVIIQEAVKDEDSTDTKSYNNIYMDKDGDGVLDAEDTIVSIENSAYINASVPIYGVYKEKTSLPFTITVKSGTAPVLYALYQGEMTVEDATAITVTIDGGRFYNAAFVAYESKVTVTNGTAIDVDVTGGSISALYGVYNSEIDAGEGIAVDVDVTGTADIQPTITGALYGVYGASTSPVNIVGDVDVYCDYEEVPASSSNVNCIFAVDSGVIVDGDVNVFVDGVMANSVKGMYGAYVKGDFSFTNTKNTCMGTINVAETATIDGNATVSISAGTSTSTYSTYTVLNTPFTGMDYLVGGDYNATYDGGTIATLKFVCASVSSGSAKKTIKGNVDVEIASGTITSRLEVLNGIQVNKDFAFNVKEDGVINNGCYLYITQTSEILGNATVTLNNGNISSSKACCYGMRDTNTTGNLTFQVNGGYYSQLDAVSTNSQSYCNVGGNLTVEYKNVNQGLTNTNVGSNYSYMTNMVNVAGDVKLLADNVVLYGFYGLYANTVGGNITADFDKTSSYFLRGVQANDVSGDVVCTIDDVIVANELYGVYSLGGKWRGTVTSNLTNVENSGYGLLAGVYSNYGTWEGAVSSILTNVSASQLFAIYSNYGGTVQQEVTATLSQCSATNIAYVVQNIITPSTMKIEITGGSYDVNAFYGANKSVAISGAKVIMNDTSITSNAVIPFDAKSNYQAGHVDVDVTGVTFNHKTNSTLYLGSYLVGGQSLLMTMDDATVLSESVKLVPCGTIGYAKATYKGVTYYAGTYQFNESEELGEIVFTGGAYYIPKDVTLKATSLEYRSGNLLLEGILDAPITGTLTDDGIVTGTYIYMYGGTLTQGYDNIYQLYYPITFNISSKGGTVNTYQGVQYHTITGQQKFAANGATVSCNIVADEGYSITKTVVTQEGATAPTELAVSGATYSFVAEGKPCTVDIEFTGNKLMLGKTIADPVAKLNQAYTKDAPVYDLSTLAISNDAVNGEITYAVDEEFGLPEGLVLDDGRIYGTPTVAYESGKKTVINVTGKNGYVAPLSLNIVITAGDSKQENQDGRIIVDEETSSIYLLGNSVILEGNGSQTEIYLDDDRNGTADYDTAVYTGDLTSYTIYGLQNIDVKNKLRITMNGGTVGTVYGMKDASITVAGDGLEMYINGGSIGTLYGLYDASVSETFSIVVGKEAVINSYSIQKNGTSVAYYCDYQGDGSFYGNYVLSKNLTVETANVYDGSLTILEGVTLTADTFYCSSNAEVNLQGHIDAATATINGGIYVQGGSVPEDSEWENVYYRYTTSTNLPKASIYFQYYFVSRVENGVTVKYLEGGSYAKATMTDAPGYHYNYIINDEAPVACTYEFGFTMPRKETVIRAEYVPKDIEVETHFADPVGVVNHAYTEAAPLYDLTTVTILNDTTTTYGSSVKYALKSGATLPAGLKLSNGKIIGTPTKQNGEGITVGFVITGRNGSTTTLNLNISIKEEGYEVVDINDVVNVSSYTIDLQGNSIVVIQDSADSTKASIYPDFNQDKVADCNQPLQIGGKNSYTLGSYSIYGYRDTVNPYNGDISITVVSGTVGKIYGAYGTSSYNKTVINGDVTINMMGGGFQNAANRIYGVYAAKVNNVSVNFTGGTYKKGNIYGAEDSEISNNLNLSCRGTSFFEGTSDSDSYSVYMYGFDNTVISGDANIKIGVDSDAYGMGSYAKFYGGFGDSVVSGNLNVTMDGYWDADTTIWAFSCDIKKDLNMNWISGDLDLTTYMSWLSDIEGDIKLTVAEDADIYGRGLYMAYGGNVSNIYANIPTSVTGSIGTFEPTTNGATVKNGIYINNKNAVSVGGTYSITENVEATSFTVLENAVVDIAEDVTIKTSTATMEDLSILKNSGMFIHTSKFTIKSGSYFVNDESGSYLAQGRTVNNGKIVNYGVFEQTYSSSYNHILGSIYTTQTLELYSATNAKNDSDLYYAVKVDYPSHCAETPTLSSDYLASSGLAGDDNQYLLESSLFTITPGALTLGDIELTSVTYGTSGNATKQSDETWDGYGVNAPMTITLNYEALDTVTAITLDKTSDSISNTAKDKPLMVNKRYTQSSPLYDLTSIAISNDSEGEGAVIYSVDSTSSLPEGLVFNNGKLYGSLAKASDVSKDIVFVIKGKNQTSAFFTLTLGAVAKGEVEWSIPTERQAVIGNVLAEVVLPVDSRGTYSWVDSSISVGNEVKTLTDIAMTFVPNDVTNYDWETAAINAGATYQNGFIQFNVDVKVCAGIPTYTVPENLTATYGQTLGDVKLPADENGAFSWQTDSNTSVGAVGSHRFYATYTPSDTASYQTVKNISVYVEVQKAVPTYKKIESVSQDVGLTLGDLVLPDVEGGKYQWITTTSTVPVDGTAYQVGFKPNDTRNYDWAALDEWNSAWNCAVFPVVVYLKHTYQITWTYDDDYHWHACVDVGCESESDKAVHIWDAGTVVVAPTEDEEGIKRFSCICGATKDVEVPVIAHNHNYGWKYDDITHWQECECGLEINEAAHTYGTGVVIAQPTYETDGVMQYTCTVCGYSKQEKIPVLIEPDDEEGDDQEESLEPGTPIEDEDGEFVVADNETIDLFDGDKDLVDEEDEEDDGMPSVVYSGPANPKATTVVVPDTIEVGDVTYKVTVIADGAFKKNKYVKKIVIGKNIKKIGASAFESCTKLTTVTFKKTSKVASIGKKAFYKCSALKKISLPASIKKIGDSAFYDCKKLATVSFEKKAKLIKIGKKAFGKCVALKKITIPDKVTTVDSSAFEGCSKMTSVTIGKAVKKIGSKAFYNCKKLKTITINTSKLTKKSIGSKAFSKAGSNYYSKMVVKVPKKNYKNYKSYLVKAGLSKKAKFVKK